MGGVTSALLALIDGTACEMDDVAWAVCGLTSQITALGLSASEKNRMFLIEKGE